MKKLKPAEAEESSVEDVLEEAAGVRGELNDVLWKEYRQWAVLFADAFDVPKPTLKRLNDLVYYQGGYPSDNSPPKSESVALRFGEAFRLLHTVGRTEDLNVHLRKLGLECRVIDKAKMAMPLKDRRPGEGLQKFAKSEGKALPKWKEEEVRRWFVDICCKLQSTICDKANYIKKDLYPKATKRMSELRKKDFRDTVALRYRSNKVEELLNDPIKSSENRTASRLESLEKSRKASMLSAKSFFHSVKMATRPIERRKSSKMKPIGE